MQFKLSVALFSLVFLPTAYAKHVAICNDTFQPVYVAELLVAGDQKTGEVTAWSHPISPGSCNNHFAVKTASNTAYLVAMTKEGDRTWEAYEKSRPGCIAKTAYTNQTNYLGHDTKKFNLEALSANKVECAPGHKKVRFQPLSTEAKQGDHLWRIQIFVDDDIQGRYLPESLNNKKHMLA